MSRAMAGEIERCRTMLLDDRGLFPQSGDGATIGRTMMLFGHQRIQRRGVLGNARRQVVEFNRLDHAHVLHWHAKMLLERGCADDHERAPTMLTEALDHYRASGMPLPSAMVQVLLA